MKYAFALAILFAANSALAAETASATISSSGSSPFHYSLTLNDTGTTTIGTFWYAWIPGYGFLNTPPTNITSPVGWSAQITSEIGGESIEWTANSPADYITAGHSLAG